MKITVDPDVDVSGFGYVEPGEYTLRVVSAEPKEGQKAPYLAWKFEHTDPNLPTVDKKPDGSNKQLGSVFDNTTLKKGDNAQFRLAQLLSALNLEWGDFDTNEVSGIEFTVDLGIEEYQGNLKNVVKRYHPAAE